MVGFICPEEAKSHVSAFTVGDRGFQRGTLGNRSKHMEFVFLAERTHCIPSDTTLGAVLWMTPYG
jgi:hypothetical protein